jgi:hypothetical protein
VLIVPNQTFLDGYDRFEPDQEYEVDDDRGAYFVSQRWASSPDRPDEFAAEVTAATPPEPVTLRPDAASTDQNAEVV